MIGFSEPPFVSGTIELIDEAQQRGKNERFLVKIPTSSASPCLFLYLYDCSVAYTSCSNSEVEPSCVCVGHCWDGWSVGGEVEVQASQRVSLRRTAWQLPLRGLLDNHAHPTSLVVKGTIPVTFGGGVAREVAVETRLRRLPAAATLSLVQRTLVAPLSSRLNVQAASALLHRSIALSLALSIQQGHAEFHAATTTTRRSAALAQMTNDATTVRLVLSGTDDGPSTSPSFALSHTILKWVRERETASSAESVAVAQGDLAESLAQALPSLLPLSPSLLSSLQSSTSLALALPLAGRPLQGTAEVQTDPSDEAEGEPDTRKRQRGAEVGGVGPPESGRRTGTAVRLKQPVIQRKRKKGGFV